MRWAAVAVLLSGVVAAQSSQVFRATEDLVTVDVGVFDGTKPVLGLAPDDFEVYDNGVRQTVEMIDIESLPIDLTVVVDVSGSVTYMIDEVRDYVREAESLLRIDDRLRLITFAGQVKEVLGIQPVTTPATTKVPLDTLVPDGATSLYDATIAALMRTRREERRQLVVVITDGYDTNSAMSADALIEVAQRSDSVLHFFLLRQVMWKDRTVGRRDTRMYWLSSADFSTVKMGYAARLTGGLLTLVATRPELPAFFRMALEEFRTSYVLRYRPTGVPPGGWHELAVTVPKSGYTIRARSGYFWGARFPR